MTTKNTILQNINFAPAKRDEGSGNTTGQVYAANDSRFSAGHLSEPLTAYSLGWSDPYCYEDLLEWIAPRSRGSTVRVPESPQLPGVHR
jgi:hypothetical protein